MEQAISSIAVEPEHIVEIVVHITEALEELSAIWLDWG
jgi:hypothetical protein